MSPIFSFGFQLPSVLSPFPSPSMAPCGMVRRGALSLVCPCPPALFIHKSMRSISDTHGLDPFNGFFCDDSDEKKY